MCVPPWVLHPCTTLYLIKWLTFSDVKVQIAWAQLLISTMPPKVPISTTSGACPALGCSLSDTVYDTDNTCCVAVACRATAQWSTTGRFQPLAHRNAQAGTIDLFEFMWDIVSRTGIPASECDNSARGVRSEHFRWLGEYSQGEDTGLWMSSAA
jgi:hypothetical protein